MNEMPSDRNDAGFSLLEALIVTLVASSMMVVLSNALVSSQAGTKRFLEHAQTRTEAAYFDAQFAELASGFLASYPDEEGLPRGLRGEADWIEGRTNHTLIGLPSPSEFRLDIQTSDAESAIRLRLEDREFEWHVERHSAVSLVYIDELGNEHETWPPIPIETNQRLRQSTDRGPQDQTLPQAIAIKRITTTGQALRIYNLQR